MNCTSIDHVYPATAPGTPCHCGQRTWAGAPALPALKQHWTRACHRCGGTGEAIGRSCHECAGSGHAAVQRRVRVGDTVRVLGQQRTVTEKLRGEDCYRVNAKVDGRTLFERAELEVMR